MMQSLPVVKTLVVLLCAMVVIAELTSAAPSYSDYENVRDLYELLLQREALENQLSQHEVVRKASRSPSLRLRFGRRADPAFAASPYADHPSVEALAAEN